MASLAALDESSDLRFVAAAAAAATAASSVFFFSAAAARVRVNLNYSSVRVRLLKAWVRARLLTNTFLIGIFLGLDRGLIFSRFLRCSSR